MFGRFASDICYRREQQTVYRQVIHAQKLAFLFSFANYYFMLGVQEIVTQFLIKGRQK